MSAFNQTSIYHGFWIDWTAGRFEGATWTLSHLDGALLQSFTAIFTTFVFAQLWSIVTFILHHARSTNKPEDGLKHQQQAVLRNTTALAAAVFFAKQTFSWHGKSTSAIVRSLKWTALALCFAVAAGLASTFSGYAASKASPNRLVISDKCGYSTYDDKNGQLNRTAYSLGIAKDTVTAANYARTCYANDTNAPGQCKDYMQRRLSWSATYNTSCPFESSICSNGDQAAFTLTTDKIDSLTGLGINSPQSERITIQKKMTCSSIREIKNYRLDNSLYYYDFGPVGRFNFTFVYNRLAEDALVSYSLASRYSYAGFASMWSPVQALNRTDADVSIVFISSNSVAYSYPNDDPIFEATTFDGTYYNADYAVSTLACAEQYQICNPAIEDSSNSVPCSPWMGAAQILFQSSYLGFNSTAEKGAAVSPLTHLWGKDQARLSSRQLAILQRIAWVLPQTSTYNAIATRRDAALRLQDSVAELVQTQHLPANYWTMEVGWWFDACLARLQQGIMDFATGPSDAAVNNNTTLFEDEETKKLCKNQLTRDIGNGTVNFSVLALSIIYAVGFTIIGLSLLLDQIGKFLYARFWPKLSFKTTVWNEDGFMLLHRAAFNVAAAGHSNAVNDGHNEVGGAERIWSSDSTPVTKQREKMVHFSITAGASHAPSITTKPLAAAEEVERDNKEATQVSTTVV